MAKQMTDDVVMSIVIFLCSRISLLFWLMHCVLPMIPCWSMKTCKGLALDEHM
ncbi:hypothetical protein BG20_I1384 [Candidatus Nitrosarchaeum limnium BG20]|uniref:Uncharacterized protein n=1 Tax=Candidatus Nitrosarchaeum limnium BG20 TaxID=859192 RepID=S2EIP2_9ARCH|nr:hypothetical protein BG20_I1384 [Candidatus Nitrosarchaeum limnium BG20]